MLPLSLKSCKEEEKKFDSRKKYEEERKYLSANQKNEGYGYESEMEKILEESRKTFLLEEQRNRERKYKEEEDRAIEESLKQIEVDNRMRGDRSDRSTSVTEEIVTNSQLEDVYMHDGNLDYDYRDYQNYGRRYGSSLEVEDEQVDGNQEACSMNSGILEGVVYSISFIENPVNRIIRETATGLGAVYVNAITGQLTHLISPRKNTPFALEAQKLETGIKIVTMDWILECKEQLKRLPEEDFMSE